MTGMESLPLELGYNICSLLAEDFKTQPSIFSLSLVSRRMRQATMPWLFGTIELPLFLESKADRCLLILESLLAAQNLRLSVSQINIRTLRGRYGGVVSRYKKSEKFQTLHNMLIDLLPRLGALQTLRIPFDDQSCVETFLRAVDSLNCRVHVLYTGSRNSRSNWEYADAFPARVTCPIVLDLEMERYSLDDIGYPNESPIMSQKGAELYRLLLKFHDIRGLTVNLSTLYCLWLYCVREKLEFPLSKDQIRCQKLEKLGFRDIGGDFKWRYIPIGVQSQLESWIETLPLANITKLRLNQKPCSWILKQGNMADISFSSLHSLCIDEERFSTRNWFELSYIARFIQNNSKISELHIHGSPELETVEVIKACGHPLRVLELRRCIIGHEVTSTCASLARYNACFDEIAAACPFIETMAVDLDWAAEPPAIDSDGSHIPPPKSEDRFLSDIVESEFFKSLYEFSNLTSLEIWMHVHPGGYIFKSEMVVREMFNRLRTKKLGLTLCELTLIGQTVQDVPLNKPEGPDVPDKTVWTAWANGPEIFVSKKTGDLDPKQDDSRKRFCISLS